MKFIIDIPEKDVQGCYSCPFNYDFIACAAPNGPDYVDIDDYLSNSFITTRPEGCPLVPVVPDQEEMDRNWPETVGELKPCPFCGGEVKWKDGAIRCWRCGLSFRPPAVFDHDAWVKRWNRRAQAGEV